MKIDLLKNQLEFINSKTRESLYSGAFGAGKTRAVCLKLVSRLVNRPGAREGLCRKHLVSLKATTLRTLLEPDGNLPPVLPRGTYEHNKSEKTIRVAGGGMLVYFGIGDAEDYTKIGSLNLSGCAVDEAVELREADWTMLRGRVRLDVGGLPMQIYGACNPGPPSHFLAKRFGLAGGYEAAANCESFTTKSLDNVFLPQAYVDDLLTLTGTAKMRYVLGAWVGSDGLVFDNFDRAVHVLERPATEFKRAIVGQDEGYTNPACLLVVLEDGDGRLHVAREWYRRNQLESDVIHAAKEIVEEFDVESFVVDPSAAKLRAAMHASNLPVTPADNDVFGGIQQVQQRFAVADDGRPRLTIDPMCKNVLRELETYEWSKNASGLQDRPKKENDHAMDALRYACAYFDGTVVQPRIRVAEEPVAARGPFDDDRMWRTM